MLSQNIFFFFVICKSVIPWWTFFCTVKYLSLFIVSLSIHVGARTREDAPSGKPKALVYGSKSNLKNHPDKTFVTEDLTRANHKTVQTLLKLKKNGKIDSFWTTDGKVLVKSTAESKPFTLSSAQAAAQKFNTELEEINDGVHYEDAMDDVGGTFLS